MLTIPVDPKANPKQRFDHLLTGLLAVPKDELQRLEAAVNRFNASMTKSKTRKPHHRKP